MTCICYIFIPESFQHNCSWLNKMIQKGTTFDHDFYVIVGKQCRTENGIVAIVGRTVTIQKRSH